MIYRRGSAVAMLSLAYSEITMALGIPRIRHFRQQRSMTAAELGEQVGLAAASISRIEMGKQNVTFDMLNAIAIALGVRMVDLIGDDDLVAYAVVRGAIGNDGDPANIFDKATTYAIPVPLPRGAEYDAFEDGNQLYVGRPDDRPDAGSYNYDFVLLMAEGRTGGAPTFEIRRFMQSGKGAGFDAIRGYAGDPAYRFILWTDPRIQRRWRILLELTFHGIQPRQAAQLRRTPGSDPWH